MAAAEGVALSTPRGLYRLVIVEAAAAPESWRVTLSLQHQGGLEKFALICTAARGPAAVTTDDGQLDQAAFAQRLGPWLEKHFESVREAALKSIRMEGRLFELPLEPDSPGPF